MPVLQIWKYLKTNWFTALLVGVGLKYIGDVIDNISKGETGWSILKPTSSLGEYAAAGISSMIPLKGLSGNVFRNVVSEGLILIEDVVSKNEINLPNKVNNFIQKQYLL